MGVVELNGASYINGLSSDPRELSWMQGVPPLADKPVSFESDKLLDSHQVRWSLSQMRELTAIVNVRRGLGSPSQLERQDRSDEIDALTFIDKRGYEHTFAEALFDTHTDGILVLHRGRVVYECYFGALEAHIPHACHSMTKSHAGTLTASFVHEGVLDNQKPVVAYLPQLRGAAWEDATHRQVMDMQTGLTYSAEYADKHASIWTYPRDSGWRPRPHGYDGPQTLCNFLKTTSKKGVHGQEVAYKTVNTDVMTWGMERVTGRSFAQLLHKRLWAPLACEEDGYLVVDLAGKSMACSGLSAALRDVIRFGELMRCEGVWRGKQLFPASVVCETRQYNDLPKFNADCSYRSMWWVSRDELGGFLSAAIHGKRLMVLPEADVVIARFASHPVASAERMS
ncbi:serine hydrolase domain-containing protein [Sinorhizobium medicae]|uniref:serine hydrolase domain-containing protein n=1 Tax=Sinorhizobium medicae TaxID=110321 RepID=UPI001F3412C4|nr:serine hydrolase [Sinorhizobium medicae]